MQVTFFVGSEIISQVSVLDVILVQPTHFSGENIFFPPGTSALKSVLRFPVEPIVCSDAKNSGIKLMGHFYGY